MRVDKVRGSYRKSVLFVLLLLTGTAATILYFPLLLTLTEEKRTSGDITFTDSRGNPVSGILEISIAGAVGERRQNVNSIVWNQVPNIMIGFNVLDTENISVRFRIAGDSPGGKVSIENPGADIPVDSNAPGFPIKYIKIDSENISFTEVDISILYDDAELNGLSEKSLSIYGFDSAADIWRELHTTINMEKNTVSATVRSLSIFAVSAKAYENLGVLNASDLSIIDPVKTTEMKNTPKKRAVTIIVPAAEITKNGEIEVDAHNTASVTVKLKVKTRRGGKIILEDLGRDNPVASAPPGTVIKYADISAINLDIDSAEVRIHYTDAELGGADENKLVIYHWNGALWDALPTSVDTMNNTLVAITTSLSPFAASAGTDGATRILVATNRYVILDDPVDDSKYAQTSEYFAVPPYTGWPDSTDRWNGNQTNITAYAMLLDRNGTPIGGQSVIFNIRNWDSSYNQTLSPVNTDSGGIATITVDMNKSNYYGNWYVEATALNQTNTANFIYNWWGCLASGCGASEHQRSDVSPGSPNSAKQNSPYTLGRESITNNGNHGSADDDNDCVGCHRSYSGVGGNTSFSQSEYTSDVHSSIKCSSCHGTGAQHKTDQPIKSCDDSSCHSRAEDDISDTNTTPGSPPRSNYSGGTGPSKYHNGSSVPCIICHGPMHNITKPDNSERFTSNNDTESSHCTECHSSYSKHNASVNCTLCHSDDAHMIKVFAQNATYVTLNKNDPNPARGNCTNCHQNSTFYSALKSGPNGSSQSGRDPPVVPNPIKHSNDQDAGRKWNTTPGYWTSGTNGSAQLSSCKYCHGETNHKTTALGRPSLWKGNNTVNSILGNTTWCTGCHWQNYTNGTNTYSNMTGNFTADGLLVPPEISGLATYGASTAVFEYTNHSLYTGYYPNMNDSSCNHCHGYLYGFTNITWLMHNQSRVGGPNCVDCHDIGGIALLAHVNVTAANDSNEMHKNLFSSVSASNSSTYYKNNKRCWACHGGGSEPANNHTANYKTPRRCPDCHLPSSMSGGNHISGLYTVCQCHFTIPLYLRSHLWNGTNVFTRAVTTCYDCHNKTEMLVYANDPDNGSGAVYGGANGGNSSASHYGMKRTDLLIGSSVNCSYCHQNASTAFASAMIDEAYNSSISNHSLRYNSSNPGCASSKCHSTGHIHSNTLTKPSLTLPSSTFCLGCHGNNGSGGTNYSGAVTGVKAKHNNTVNCTECHLNNSKDVHPVRYLHPDATYNTANSTGVNCITCHQTSSVDSKLSLNPRKVPTPMVHSDNGSNGTLWNSIAYWTSNNSLTACTYCHNDTRHNATALGRPAEWKGSNTVNSSINTSNWCSSCHYRGYSSYTAMSQSFTSSKLPVPPEISNGTFAPYNLSRYYNHSLTNYSDATCRLCHGTNISSSTTISALVHNITWGACINCHYSFNAMNSTLRPERYVNSTMYNTSLHGSLACSNCHTKGHRNIGARKACEDCHAVQQDPRNESDRHNITGSPSTYFYSGTGVVNITDCITCHNSSVFNNATATYGYGKSKDCDYCHTSPDKYYG